MRKAIALSLAILLGLSYLPGCARQGISIDSKTSTPSTKGQEVNIDISDVIKSIYEDLYIGEACKSGFVYIEPFSVERTSDYVEVSYNDYPDCIEFYALDQSNARLKSAFDSLSNIYIPTVEEDSKYYWQGFSEPNQYVLRYKTSSKVDDTFIGVTFFNNQVSQIDFSCTGKKRTYSEPEHNEAVKQVEKGKEDRENIQGALREITIKDTIVGAEQICLVEISDTSLKILLSKYLYVGVESTADVYVIDFIEEGGKVLQTYQKYNWVSY